MRLLCREPTLLSLTGAGVLASLKNPIGSEGAHPALATVTTATEASLDQHKALGQQDSAGSASTVGSAKSVNEGDVFFTSIFAGKYVVRIRFFYPSYD